MALQALHSTSKQFLFFLLCEETGEKLRRKTMKKISKKIYIEEILINYFSGTNKICTFSLRHWRA